MGIPNGVNEQIIIDNLLISYASFSARTTKNQSLLFLHGWRSSKEVWTGLINQMAGVGYKIFAMDLPGFGSSQPPQRPMTVGDYAEVVGKFVKKLELQDVVVVGHSFGGRVAIKLAAYHPDLIQKLVLVDSAGFAMDQYKKRLMAGAAKIIKPFFQPKFMQGFRKKIYQSLGAEDYVAMPELQQTFINITQEDLSSDMKKINCPTLIINGENDTDTPVEFARRMQSLISNSQFIILKDAGHFSFIDQPEEFVKNLNKFLN